jgi:hypothetical protein
MMDTIPQPATTPVQNPCRGTFIAERTSTAVAHLRAARRLCDGLEGLLTSGEPIDQRRFQKAAQDAVGHVQASVRTGLLSFDETEGQA